MNSVTRTRPLRFECLEVRSLLAVDLVVSEFLASNAGGLEDGDGNTPDWIEIYNNTSSPINLSGYYLTDDAADLDKWAFPTGAVIERYSPLIVFASDKDDQGPEGELHTNFKLSAGGEFLGLVEPDGLTVVHSYAPEFPSQVENVSYGVSMSTMSSLLVDESSALRYLVPSNGSQDAIWRQNGFDDSGWSLATAGLGYENSPNAAVSYDGLINAPVPSGATTAYARYEFNLADPQAAERLLLSMQYDDGFIAYLNGVEVASDYAPSNPAWNSIAGGMRGDEVVLEDLVEFDISEFSDQLVAGENVLAIHALNVESSSDMLMIARLEAVSFTVAEPLAVGNFLDPTPGAPNGEAFIGVVEDTKFSVDRGFFDAPFQVEVTSDTEDALVVYTTDGSAPSVDAQGNVVNGLVYNGAITVAETTTLRAAAFKQDYIATNVDTQSYFFLSDVIQQRYATAIDDGYPATWGSRAADYGLDPDVIGPSDLYDGVYAAQIEQSLLAIPTVSLTIDVDDMFGPSGIYSNPTASGVLWERPVSAEWIFADGTEGFQVDAGLRIHGAASRVLSDKNALRLLFKAEYGDSKLDYPLFGDGVDQFDTIVLRPHFNDGWGWDGALDDPVFARDQWFRDTQDAMGHASSRGNLAHLYINGQYWGVYNPSERPDDSFSAETWGGDKDDYDVMVSDGVHDGTGDAYATMLSLAQAVVSASGTSAKATAYQRLQGNYVDGTPDPTSEDFLDVVNYIDYMILNHYGGNNDWPDRNWYASRQRGSESEGFRFVAWDSEISLALSNRTTLTDNNLGESSGAAEAYSILRNYDEFLLQFADRIHEHLFNGGALYVNPDNPDYDPLNPQDNVPAARMAELTASVEEAMVAESARWGDQHVQTPRTVEDDWQPSVDYLLDHYFTQRHAIVLSQWRAAGLYPLIDAPEFEVNGTRQHGGAIAPGDTFNILNLVSGGQGTVYYTTDGTDPRLVGGAVNTSSALAFSEPIDLTETVTVQSRSLWNGVWSALTQATFATPSADYDGNGIVEIADYDVWVSSYGATGADLPADGNGDGVVDAADYSVWRDVYANASAAAAVSASVGQTAEEAAVVEYAAAVGPIAVDPIASDSTSQHDAYVVAVLSEQTQAIVVDDNGSIELNLQGSNENAAPANAGALLAYLDKSHVVDPDDGIEWQDYGHSPSDFGSGEAELDGDVGADDLDLVFAQWDSDIEVAI